MVYAFEFGRAVSLEYSGRHFPLALLFLPCCYDMCFFSGGNDQFGRQWTKNSSWCVWGTVIHSLFSSRLSNRHQWSLCSETVLVQVAKMSYENKVTRFLAMPGVCG